MHPHYMYRFTLYRGSFAASAKYIKKPLEMVDITDDVVWPLDGTGVAHHLSLAVESNPNKCQLFHYSACESPNNR